jgi:predicted nucleic acid-binding Zn ribbon protein
MSSDKHSFTFKDAFGQFLKNEHLDVKYKQKKLIDSWERIMGRPIAARTTKMFFRDGTLFVELSSAALKEELNRSHEVVLARIEEHMGEKLIDQVRFI